MPSHIVGSISLVALAVAIVARYKFQMLRAWRWIYVVSAVMALYLNCFVLVVQSFLKIPALNALAPTQTEPPFAIAQPNRVGRVHRPGCRCGQEVSEEARQLLQGLLQLRESQHWPKLPNKLQRCFPSWAMLRSNGLRNWASAGTSRPVLLSSSRAMKRTAFSSSSG